ncbi:MAG: polysaccharide deacetylase family protein [Eubacteriales bacterium]
MRFDVLVRGLTICAALVVIGILFQNTGIRLNIEENSIYSGSELIENETLKIALTFDDGPSDIEGGTDYLLDGLASRGVQATFFVLGSRAEDNPLIMTRLYEEGHLIGNHTYSHVDLADVSLEQMLEELEKTNQIIESYTGEEVVYMRPPYGDWNSNYNDEINMVPVFWTIDSLDWTTDNVEEIVNRVVTQAQENDIILMHDCYPSSSEAAFQIIDILQERGFEFVTVDEILNQ